MSPAIFLKTVQELAAKVESLKKLNEKDPENALNAGAYIGALQCWTIVTNTPYSAENVKSTIKELELATV